MVWRFVGPTKLEHSVPRKLLTFGKSVLQLNNKFNFDTTRLTYLVGRYPITDMTYDNLPHMNF